MSNSIIYFPRIDKFWGDTKNKIINAYLNVLKYAKSDIDEELLELALGGEIPVLCADSLTGERISREKNLAYVCGLYYEEYFHDCDEMYVENIIKNLKMRIVAPILYLRGEVLELDTNQEVPVVCCGFDYDANRFIVVNPLNGGIIRVSLEACYLFDRQKKMIMLNIPGLVKIHDIDKAIIVRESIRIYLNRYLFLEFLKPDKYYGLKALELLGKDGDLQGYNFHEHFEWQKKWLEIALRHKEHLRKHELEMLACIYDVYTIILEENMMSKKVADCLEVCRCGIAEYSW